MTDLRKAAEMALEVLEADREHITYESAVYSAALALRQALAQPEQECNRKSDRQLLKEALRSLNHLSQNAIKSKTDLILSLDYAKQSINEIGVRIREPEEISDYHEGWEEGFKAGLAKAQLEQEPTVPDNMQDWANLDGDIAWHLIDRHADNWADIKKMMDEFVAAKIASAQSKHECETCVNKRKRPEQSGFLKSPLRGEE